MQLDDETRLHHMLHAARRASAFTAGRSREDLDEEDLQTQGLVRMLEIIGEAASQISPEGRARWTGINWRPIISMRNRLIHGYFDVDLDVVWLTISEDVPLLITELERILALLGSTSPLERNEE
jgi:uncharacterized protein with HEPN domain